MAVMLLITVDFTKDLNLQVTWASNGNWKMLINIMRPFMDIRILA